MRPSIIPQTEASADPKTQTKGLLAPLTKRQP